MPHVSTFLDMLEPMPDHVDPQTLPTVNNLYHQFVEDKHREVSYSMSITSPFTNYSLSAGVPQEKPQVCPVPRHGRD
jgi:hypothetical protein